jgi:hypothetical protein
MLLVEDGQPIVVSLNVNEPTREFGLIIAYATISLKNKLISLRFFFRRM